MRELWQRFLHEERGGYDTGPGTAGFALLAAANTFTASPQTLSHPNQAESQHLRFAQRTGAVAAVAPWDIFSMSVGTSDHDQVLSFDYNGHQSGRIVAGEHTAHMGFESRWTGAVDPATVRGQFEWNFDIGLALTGAVATVVRPWAFYYDMDARKTNTSFGIATEEAASRFTYLGKVGVGGASNGMWLRVRPTVASAEALLTLEAPSTHSGSLILGTLNDVTKFSVSSGGDVVGNNAVFQQVTIDSGGQVLAATVGRLMASLKQTEALLSETQKQLQEAQERAVD